MTTAQEQKKQERRARRHLIQEAAREIFATKGYAKTSIEQVAQGASLSVGAIYLYFRSKEDLYISLIETPLANVAAMLNEPSSDAEGTRLSPLRSAWSRLIAWATSDPESAVILRSLAQPELRTRLSSEVIEAVSEGLTQVNQALESAVRAGLEQGYYRSVDATEMAGLVWSLFLGLVHSAHIRRTVDDQGPSLQDNARWAFEAIEMGIRVEPTRVAEAA